jgi:hypothetical protein
VLADRRATLSAFRSSVLIEVALDTARHHEQAEAFDLSVPDDVSVLLGCSRIDDSFGDF